MDISAVITSINEEFAKLADPDRAFHEKKYLKSPDRFYGVKVPLIRKIVKDFRRMNKDLPKPELWQISGRLWQGQYHEEKTAAMVILEEYIHLLGLEDLPKLEAMLQQSVNWDQVDEIAIHLVGEILMQHDGVFEYLKKWSADDNFWMRRSSLIAQILLFRKRVGDIGLFYSFAGIMLEEKEFFIRKAIGWTLRELSKTNPDEVFGFIRENKDRMSGLTFREGSRKLPEELRCQL